MALCNQMVMQNRECVCVCVCVHVCVRPCERACVCVFDGLSGSCSAFSTGIHEMSEQLQLTTFHRIDQRFWLQRFITSQEIKNARCAKITCGLSRGNYKQRYLHIEDLSCFCKMVSVKPPGWTPSAVQPDGYARQSMMHEVGVVPPSVQVFRKWESNSNWPSLIDLTKGLGYSGL